jgi:16S rRNA (cytosine967-C5)-methyltransferase
VPTATIGAARLCAYRVCRRVFEQGAYADRALVGEAGRLDARDRALATRLSYGTIQRLGTLDRLIETLARRPPGKLDAHVRAALRLGLYELLFLDGAPDRAVVAAAVELAKQSGRGGHGLVNAVLRRATVEGPGMLAELRDDTAEEAAVRHSHPLWLARMWFAQLGADEARALMAADNEPAETALRANSLVQDADALAALIGLPSHRDPELPEALVLDAPFDAHGSPLWAAGAYMAQSRAAMLVSHVLDPRPGERVLDLCGAPGGKTTHLAALMQRTGEVVTVERHAGRAAALRETCMRMAATNVCVEVADAAVPRAPGDAFDRVLVDPPCSGLGTLQARPDLRWRASPDSIAELVEQQAAILAAGAAAVRSGGVLVYSTCTLSAAENEGQIDAFLHTHPGFTLEDRRAAGPRDARSGPVGIVSTLPHRDGTAGFFIARMRRER